MTDSQKDLAIIQLCDYMNILKKVIKAERPLTLWEANCLNWEAIVKDEKLKERINIISNYK